MSGRHKARRQLADILQGLGNGHAVRRDGPHLADDRGADNDAVGQAAQFINLFGTAIVRPVRSTIVTPLILEPADDAKKFDPKTVVLPVSQFNRDYYRVGVGIDFLSFIRKLLAHD